MLEVVAGVGNHQEARGIEDPRQPDDELGAADATRQREAGDAGILRGGHPPVTPGAGSVAA